MTNENKMLSAAPAWQPTREIELIVGTPPGGGQDRPARTLMRALVSAKRVKVPMRLSNIAGKGGGNAWDALRARAGDPHVLSISSLPLLSNRILGISDFDHAALTPLANLYSEYLAFIVPANSAIRSAAQMYDLLKANPGATPIALATAIGSTNHIALGQLLSHAGADPRALKLRVFDSALYAVDDVVAGNAQVGVISAVSARKALESGTARVLAVSAPARLGGVFAEAPTWTELAVPCIIGQWRGVMGAPGIEAAHIEFWAQALAAAVESSEWKDDLAANSWSADFMSGAKLRTFLDAERDFVDGMLRALGLIG